ncbi:ABC transporter permease [Paracoccus sp. IB05]|uniref:ABC transporter permease n=1 Tax=Paracoccus sp. IB05 TaxID=2779367 RepID=UPI0018E83A6C|nr:ABC transporter permease [Paracoccus sp. IB05]MBJ2153034.1 ABC transporter permease [Paracoccus sp. IB05]
MLLDFRHLGALRWVLVAIGLLVAGFLLLPVVFIVLLSFGSSRWLIFPPPGWTLKWYEAFFADPGWFAALGASLRVGLAAAVIAVVFGLGAALAMSRGRLRGAWWLHMLLLMPMVLPVVVLAVGIYSLALRAGLNDTFIGFVLSHAIVALPFTVIILVNGLNSFDPSLEDAAVLCGASRWRARLHVTFPSIRLSIITAVIFAFLISWDEIVISIFMAGPNLQTLPVKLWTTLRQDLTPVIAVASTMVLAFSLILLLIAAILTRRGR